MSEPDQKRPKLRVVLLGGSGLLGGAFRAAWAAHPAIDLLPLSRAEVNLTQIDRIPAALDGLACDVLVNAAAYTRVDDAETAGGRELAMALNGQAPGVLAQWAAQHGARLVHFSTDYVFDGRKQTGYTEADAPCPISAYGESKRLGEELVLNAGPRHLVVRLSWLCGPARPAFPQWLLGQAASQTEVRVVADKVACPTWAPDVVAMLEHLFLRPDPPTGVLHLCHPPACTWLEWGQAILDAARAAGLPLLTHCLTPVAIRDLRGLTARRPPHSVLDTSRLAGLLGTAPRPWTDFVGEMARPV